MSEVVEESRVRRPVIEPPQKHDHATGPAAHPAQSPISALHASVGNRRLSRVLSAPGAINRMILQAMPASTAASALAQREEAAPEDEEELMAKHETPDALREEAPMEDEEEQLAAKHEDAGAAPVVGREGGEIDSGLAGSIDAQRGSGSELRSDVRSRMEGSFGVDFSGVKIHQDSASDGIAQSISARAFTTGNDIFLRRDEHDSDTTLIAHELAHVVQQSGGVGRMSDSGMSVGAANDPLELEADRAAELVSSGAGPARLEADA